ncbi:MAG TPA: YraN family protein [Candidatus Kapabacteria bacterium]|nr:YraN family protein [Candidatus Kapabacteria bacterium]
MQNGHHVQAPQPTSAAQGHLGEEEACGYLTSLGYRIIKRNFHYGKIGEIDIIAMDGEQLVFVEVKARSSYDRGKPEDFVDVRKQRQLKRVAEGYYHINKLTDQACRFDVVGVDLVASKPEIRHIKTAFY